MYLSPNTTTSLNHLISQIETLKRADPLRPVHILLPTSEAVRYLRRQMPPGLNLHLLQFYALAETVLDRAAVPVTRIHASSVRALVQHMLAELHNRGELTTFAPVRDKPGFIEVVIEWLREVKTQGIPPEDIQAHAVSSHSERGRQLAAIYTRYQSYLQDRRLSDADGLLWLAAEALDDDAGLARSAGPFFAFGFDQFNPIQVRLLRALSARFSGFSIYLSWDPDRPADSLALARLSQTRQVLQRELAPNEYVLAAAGGAHPVLQHLRRSLFERSEGERRTARPDDPAPVHAIEAPSREAEVRWALRAIKRRLLAGVSPEEVAVLAPQPGAYAPIVQAVAQEYGLPVQTRQPLAANPAVAALANMLRLAPNFPWRETLEALRSPYIAQPWLTGEQIDLLDRLSRERPVVAGREQWRFALQPVQLPVSAAEDEDLGPPPLVSQLPPDQLGAIEGGLSAFFDRLTPPEYGSCRVYAMWIQEAILGLYPEPDPGEDSEVAGPAIALDVHARCQREAATSRRDLAALAVLLDVLRGMVAAQELLPGGNQTLAWEAFREWLFRELATPMPPDPHRAAVRFGPLEAGRVIPVEYLFVLGLSEGEFPQPPPPDALYAPAERHDHPLPLRRYRPADEASLWWQAVGNCRRELFLLRPRLDESGAPWLPSPYWQAVLDKVPGAAVETIPIAALPELEQACSTSELLLALAAGHARSVPAELQAQWRAAQAAQATASQRQSWNAPSVHEGYIQAASLQAELSRRYGPAHGWSVSRLNAYGSCPYGFFAQSVLQLDPRPDPEAGLDPMQRGSLLHALLERLHQRLAAEGLALTSENQPAILAHLEAVCDELFPTAPQRYGFRASALWRHEQAEFRRQIEALVLWECEQDGPVARFQPYQQELRFGIPGAQLPKLSLQAQEGTAFQVHGVIDRVDRDEQGHLRIIDYKSGSTTYSKNDIERGYALQSALYALAAERLLGGAGRVAESYYLHIPKRSTSGRLRFEDGAEADEVVRAAVAAAAQFVEQVRSGLFPSAPGKPATGAQACRDSCEFAALCRASRQSIAKARRALA